MSILVSSKCQSQSKYLLDDYLADQLLDSAQATPYEGGVYV